VDWSGTFVTGFSSYFSFSCQFVWAVNLFCRSLQDLEIRTQKSLPQAGDISGQTICLVSLEIRSQNRLPQAGDRQDRIDELTFVEPVSIEIRPKKSL
jgi:hypothetical protein